MTLAGKSYLPVVLVIAAALAAYMNTIAHEFVFDDFTGIAGNPLIAGPVSMSEVWTVLDQPWRPFLQMTYALTFYFFGAGPAAFHVTNVLIHALNSVLVVWIAQILSRRWMPESDSLFALGAGLVHATHPIYSEAVAYIWGRSSSLCATFYFLSLISVLTALSTTGKRKYFCYAGAAVFGLAAWNIKEEAITLPLLIAALMVLDGKMSAAIACTSVPLFVALWRWSDILERYSTVAQSLDLASVAQTSRAVDVIDVIDGNATGET